MSYRRHKLCATFSVNVNINYCPPIKVYYCICTLRDIRIEINHGSQNVFWALTWIGGYNLLISANPCSNSKHILASMIYFLNKMNCELMLTYDILAHWQTGSRNLMGQKTLPTIWGTYMTLVTKYQISAINSCWEKCY